VSEDPRELQSRPSVLTAAAALIDAEESYYPAFRERRDVENELRSIPFLEFRRRRELHRRWADVYNRQSRAWDSLRKAQANWNRNEVSIRSSARLLMENLFFRTYLRNSPAMVAPYSIKVQQPPPHAATFCDHQPARQSTFFEHGQQRACSYGSVSVVSRRSWVGCRQDRFRWAG
jgi:hypothetical protein